MGRILIVEDNADLAEGIAFNLKLEGHETMIAPDGVKGIDAFRTFDPELVLLDLMLPSETGWDFLRERRGDPELANVRVVVLSAAPRDLLLHARDLGADAFLSSKPFELDVLTAVVQGVVN